MTWLRSEEEVDAMIEEMVRKTKGKYIHQGIAFKKDSPEQMELLKKVLMSSYSFGAYIKELLTEHFNDDKEVKYKIENKVEEVSLPIDEPVNEIENESSDDTEEIETAPQKKNIADFI